MGSPDIPKVEEAPPPVEQTAGDNAGESYKKFMKQRKGMSSTWLTKGNSLGGGRNLG